MINIRHVSELVLASVLSVTTSICLAETGAVGSALTTPAMQIVASSRAVFIDLARAADRLIAVGERGLIVLSDDNGQSWRQVPVPVSVSLSAVYFVDAQRGWAVGHAGTVLATIDGGEHWAVQLNGLQAAQIELQAAQAEKVTAADAEAAAERIVADVAALAIPHAGSSTGGTVSISVGAASHHPAAAAVYSTVAKLADNALYAAKNQGRNRCVCVKMHVPNTAPAPPASRRGPHPNNQPGVPQAQQSQ